MSDALGVITEILAEQFEVDQAVLRPETTLEELELDSLALLEFSLVLAERTGLRVSDEDVTRDLTLRQIAEWIETGRDLAEAGLRT
ncbi:acyl carrier protein [Streptomyces buecherae]|uniref:Acyl carrier protein n=1 Tax=Streptomyces buecherae TaxID=2763006 RepID=A0A7H8N3G7_9ACTN|nr:acyl carrier protein [Streptomyces buecherae]MBC3984589.1 acyl carrier protein [Streptomyces buecherae]QKW48558.1 acyl carrier protein [Streptomyces buecherae]QNJ43740.1 acyl carrier protein [Streptomyces buecherae]